MSVLTVLAALIVTTRFGSANAFAGQNYEMDAIAACIVGGVSAYGGSGTVMGMVIGATLIGVIIKAYGTYADVERGEVVEGWHTVTLSFVRQGGEWRLDTPTY